MRRRGGGLREKGSFDTAIASLLFQTLDQRARESKEVSTVGHCNVEVVSSSSVVVNKSRRRYPVAERLASKEK